MEMNDAFEHWYNREGVRFFTKEGHKEYMRFAYMAGRAAQANDFLRPKKMPEPFYHTKTNYTYNWKR
jgi:hypothetical protein